MLRPLMVGCCLGDDSTMTKRTEEAIDTTGMTGAEINTARRLGVKERALIAAKLQGMSTAKAGEVAGFKGSSAYEVMRRTNVRAYMETLMERAGLSDEALVDRLRDGLDATVREVTKAGDVVEAGPDWANRYKFLELSFKVMDRLPVAGRQELNLNSSQAIIIRMSPSLDGDD